MSRDVSITCLATADGYDHPRGHVWSCDKTSQPLIPCDQGCIDDSDCLNPDKEYCNRKTSKCEPILCPCDSKDKNSELQDCDGEAKTAMEMVDKTCKKGFIIESSKSECIKSIRIECSPKSRAWMVQNSELLPPNCVEGCASDSDCDPETGFGRCSDCVCSVNLCPAESKDPNSVFVEGYDQDSVTKECNDLYAFDKATGKRSERTSS